MKELQYPFDSHFILKNRKKIKKELLSQNSEKITKKIAVLGGSTTADIVAILDLFLLDNGIMAEFYQSEYNKYWEGAVFENKELSDFSPDLIYIHTTSKNLSYYEFNMSYSKDDYDTILDKQYEHFKTMWKKLKESYNCPIIQNNFEMPHYRILGNRDSWDFHGRVNFISRLNMQLYEYAQSNESFFINDINYISACYGLEKWFDPKYWYMYKYAVSPEAIPDFAYNLCNIIKSVFGKNKKALALDLDNTLWGGIIGEDSVSGIDIGHENAIAESYYDFQCYIKEQAQTGIMLTICSKNNEETALEGLMHPDGVLKPDDFISIKANWEQKDKNIISSAEEIGILPESFVFVDDNPAEREIVNAQLDIPTPEITAPENYIRILNKSGFFEITSFSNDDLSRNDMYKANAKRKQSISQFENYEDYLKNLDMTAVIEEFNTDVFQRISTLTLKSNQFNLTTKRYLKEEIKVFAESDDVITLYAKLSDKFGDNGIVSAVIGKINNDELHIDLWIMSCRVLKRNLEFAILDTLIDKCRKRNITKVYGYYYSTKKNSMVSKLYEQFGFNLISTNENNDSIWLLETKDYSYKNNVINVLKGTE